MMETRKLARQQFKKETIKEKPFLQPVKLERKSPNKQNTNYDPKQYPKYCPSCWLLFTAESNFCSKCGNQLFIKP